MRKTSDIKLQSMFRHLVIIPTHFILYFMMTRCRRNSDCNFTSLVFLIKKIYFPRELGEREIAFNPHEEYIVYEFTIDNGSYWEDWLATDLYRWCLLKRGKMNINFISLVKLNYNHCRWFTVPSLSLSENNRLGHPYKLTEKIKRLVRWSTNINFEA